MKRQNPRLVLIAIGLLFFAPLLLAVLMRSAWWDFRPSNFSNLGTLVQPQVAMPVSGLDLQYSPSGAPFAKKNQWVLLYPFPTTCDSSCQQDVTGLRQIHIATGQDRVHVSVWLLTPQQSTPETQQLLLNIYPGFEILIDTSGDAMNTLASLADKPSGGGLFLPDGQAFLLDPASNIILRYAAGFDPNDVKQDLDRLLAWSGRE